METVETILTRSFNLTASFFPNTFCGPLLYVWHSPPFKTFTHWDTYLFVPKPQWQASFSCTEISSANSFLTTCELNAPPGSTSYVSFLTDATSTYSKRCLLSSEATFFVLTVQVSSACLKRFPSVALSIWNMLLCYHTTEIFQSIPINHAHGATPTYHLANTDRQQLDSCIITDCCLMLTDINNSQIRTEWLSCMLL